MSATSSPGIARPRLSVITPTHNRAESLIRLLRGLRDGTQPPGGFEVIVVADGCTDDSVSRAREELMPFPVQVIEQSPGRGAAAARNLGAEHARGELLVFVDDDIEPLSTLLLEHDRAHSSSSEPCVVIGAPLPVRSPESDMHTLVVWSWWEQQFARMRRPSHRFNYSDVFSGVLSLPADLFRKVGGFDVGFDNCRDDSELGLRLIDSGARILFVPDAGGWHHELRDLDRLVSRKIAEGRADVRLATKRPELIPTLRLAEGSGSLRSLPGVLRHLAINAPAMGGILAGLIARSLLLLEWLRMRATWRLLQGGLMYYWYWRGAARALGSRHALVRLISSARNHGARPPKLITLDLAEGLTEAERALDTRRPDGVILRYGDLEIGSIDPEPGSERLRGAHLRGALATELAGNYGKALQIAMATGQIAPEPLLALPEFGHAGPAGTGVRSLLEVMEDEGSR